MWGLYLTADIKDGGMEPGAKQCGQPLEAREQRNRFSPKVSRKEHNNADTLILTQWDPGQISDLLNCKITI